VAAPAPAPTERRSLAYASYVLFVLVLVYLFNFVDRQLPSILAERIKADFAVSDADLGFLYGTAFAVFYAIFGIPLGRLADVWNRRSLVALGLAFWSAMTALSGLSRNLDELKIARVGVAVGEASATPAAYSMLSDYFPASLRATALSIYSSGIYIGGGLALFVGGRVVGHWDATFADAAAAPFGLAGWQATFVIVGLPGLLMALWVRSLREPRRGQADGLPETAPHPHPFREFGRELRAVVPGLTVAAGPPWRATWRRRSASPSRASPSCAGRATATSGRRSASAPTPPSPGPSPCACATRRASR